MKSIIFAAMKFFAFIMAMMVLMLSCMPCKDGVFAMKAKKAKIEISKSTTKHGAQSDACSPFCQCACCAGFSICHSFNKFSVIIPLIISQHYSSFLPSGLNEISFPIWQPPQL